MNTHISTALIRADSLLDQISVKGNDVFVLAQARQTLKAAFDELLKTDVKDGDDNGG